MYYSVVVSGIYTYTVPKYLYYPVVVSGVNTVP